MISFISGTVADLYEDSMVLECNDIGYQIQIPSSFMNNVRIGSRIKVHTYLQVREDAMCLYGFQTKDDLTMFRMLIGVNGIGPKGALGILSVITPDDLRFAVLADDAKTISKAPGVGLKTAKKLILELKDKLSLEEAIEIKSSHGAVAAAAVSDERDEALQALIALGYSPSEAMKAIKGVAGAETMDVSALIKAALKNLSLF